MLISLVITNPVMMVQSQQMISIFASRTAMSWGSSVTSMIPLVTARMEQKSGQSDKTYRSRLLRTDPDTSKSPDI